MNRQKTLLLLTIAIAALPACARQTSPSMMSTEKPRVSHETSMEQVPVKNVSDGYLYNLASNYQRYGMEQMHLSLAYDPAAKNYGATKAFQDLARIKDGLGKYGVRSVTAETVQSSGAEPTLMISYDSARALAPEGCNNMPGLASGLTTEKIADYRFGCSVDSMVANQIYRPADLYGNGSSEVNDGRRASMMVDYYRQVTPEEAGRELDRIGRSDIQGEGQ